MNPLVLIRKHVLAACLLVMCVAPKLPVQVRSGAETCRHVTSYFDTEFVVDCFLLTGLNGVGALAQQEIAELTAVDSFRDPTDSPSFGLSTNQAIFRSLAYDRKLPSQDRRPETTSG